MANGADPASPAAPPARRLVYSVALISGAALAYQILLMRLLAMVQWPFVVGMIISLALLGYGASGSVLSLLGERARRRVHWLYPLSACAFALGAVGCWALAQRVPFNPLELIWNPQQLLGLTAIYLLLALPFFCAASCIGLAFMCWGAAAPRLYRADLMGAGIGALLLLTALFLVPPVLCLQAVAVIAVAAAPLARADRGILAAAAALAVLLAGPWTASALEPRVSEYKGLPRQLQIGGARVVTERYSPLGWLSVVESPRVPLRYAPGQSLTSPHEPPPQLAVFTDADAMSVISRFDGDPARLGWLEDLTSALPYQLLTAPHVAVLGAGGGLDVLQALALGAARVDAVELNPQLAELLRDSHREFAGDLYRHPQVRLHVADARAFMSGRRERFDLIQLSLLDSYASAGAGAQAVNESYLYTVESLRDYYARLAPGGYLSITRWHKLPPRDALKLALTAAIMLEQQGADPARQLILIHGWQTDTLLLKRGPVDAADRAKLRDFCRARGFTLAYAPGESAPPVRGQEAILAAGMRALLGPEREAWLRDYKFALAPATDDRPYFFHFFRWRLLPELLRMREQGAMVLLDTGYVVLVATLLQALPLAVLLILAPLALRRLPRGRKADTRWRPAAYFLCLGLAFLFIEIAFIQKLILLAGHPLYAAAAALGGFLVFAGLGSGASAQLRNPRRGLAAAVGGIATVGLGLLLLLPLVADAVGAWPVALKVPLVLLLIAPLAFCMGLPFPLGLRRLAAEQPALVPWAWGINGCASVLSALLASLIALHFGFGALVLCAVLVYGLAVLVWPPPPGVSEAPAAARPRP